MPWRFKLLLLEDGAQAPQQNAETEDQVGRQKALQITATGKIKAGVAGKRHRLISHNAKYIRQNRGTKVMSASGREDHQDPTCPTASYPH